MCVDAYMPAIGACVWTEHFREGTPRTSERAAGVCMSWATSCVREGARVLMYMLPFTSYHRAFVP